MEDAAIVGLYWKRDEAAVLETEQKYGRYLTKIAFNILASIEDSRESVNDTYLKAWASMPPHKPGILSTYLGKITRQNSIDMRRKRGSKKRCASEYALSLSELTECASMGDSPEQEFELKLLANAINAYLRTLSKEVRSVFVGRYYFSDSIKEIATYHDMGESKTKSILYRTRVGLKAHLEKEGFLI